MIRKLLKVLGIGMAVSSPINGAELPEPYEDKTVNIMYNLIFCDEPSLFNSASDELPAYWQNALFNTPSKESVSAIAEDTKEESRVRLLAYSWLKEHKIAIKKGVLLGVVIEVPLDGGLDTLAAYADGRVRYINQSGKLTIVEEGASPSIEKLAKELVGISVPVVQKIGPWGNARLPPPEKGYIRMTFLASDGLYFGEGPISIMQNEPMAAPVIGKAIELLQEVVDTTIDSQT